MVDVKGTTITIARGDDAAIEVQIIDSDGSIYQPAEGDSVRFALKKL